MLLRGFSCFYFFSGKRACKIQDEVPTPSPRRQQLWLQSARTGLTIQLSSWDRNNSLHSSRQQAKQSLSSDGSTSSAYLILHLVISLGFGFGVFFFFFFLFRGVRVTTSSERAFLLQAIEKVTTHQPQPSVPSPSSVFSTRLQSRSTSSRYLTPYQARSTDWPPISP